MGFEGPLLFKNDAATSKERKLDKPASRKMNRRGFLEKIIGGAAAAVVAEHILPASTAEAGEIKYVSLDTREGIEQNVHSIEEYQKWLVRYRHILEDEYATREQLDAIIFSNGRIPVTERKYLKGTRYDHLELYTRTGSYPAVQLRRQLNDAGQTELEFRFSNNMADRETNWSTYANGFIIEGNWISNEHVAEDVVQGAFNCETLEGIDIAGYTISDFNNETLNTNASRVTMSIDRRSVNRDMHGEYVDATGLHETRGSGIDHTEVMSGVLIKVTPVILKHYFPYVLSTDNEKKLLNSYMYIVPPREVNGDNIPNQLDVQGMSGSSLFAHSDTSRDILTPCGIVFASAMIDNESIGTSHVVAFVHGPNTLVQMNDKLNTIASHTDEADISYKRALVSKIQRRLAELGYYNAVVDGDYGSQTQLAVNFFQESVFDRETLESSVIPTEVDRRTWDKLFPDEAGVTKQALYASLGG